MQREGYVLALTSKEFLQALRQGPHGKIAVTYFEWAGQSDQKIIMPWRVIDGPEAADAVAAEITRAPYRRASRTSISGALRFAKPLFDDSGYKGLRRVIDVSGDGANNAGPLVVPTRDDVLAAGITINGLPIMLKRPYVGTMDIEDLDVYYEDCVIGGPGAFVVPIREREKFIEATRTKLVLEIAGRQPEAKVRLASSERRAFRAQSAKRCGRSVGAAEWIFGTIRHPEATARSAGLEGWRLSSFEARFARASGWRSLLKLRDDFHVIRIAELVDRSDGRDPVAAADENLGIAGKRRRVTRNCDHKRHRTFG